ncbi:MAG TPA: helix-turn-helix domain-containing protein, partial [Draconibacterium sp.]|nr:helix-turn-helix domain-containing protein [Draconibacterium sp.]
MTFYLASDKEFIEKLTEIIINNIAHEDFGVEKLVVISGLSHNFIRHRLKSINGKTISQLISEVRLQQALEMLQQGEVTVSEVAYKVGFSSPAYFNTCFHDHFGFPPGEVKKRFPENHKEHAGINPSENKNDVRKHFNTGKKTRRIRKTVIYSVLGTLTFFVLSWFVYSNFILGKPLTPFEKQEKSIVVLPFKNLSDNDENQHFADGITQDILNHLNSIDELRVISRTSAERYRESTKSAPEIARELGVNFILEGSVQVYQDKVKIMVQLVDARRDKHLFSEKIEKEMTDIFRIESSIAEQVADKLQTTLS